MEEIKETKPEYAKPEIKEQLRGEDIFGSINTKNFSGFYPTVTSIPSTAPTNYFDQIKIYYNAITGWQLCVWDNTNEAWKFVVLT